MAKFKSSPISVQYFFSKSKDTPANEKNGWPVIPDGEFDFDHPLQRREKQWSPFQQSELIQSLILEYVIPPVYVLDEKRDYGRTQLSRKRVVIDGKQRLTTIRSYMRGEFALHKSIKPVEINGLEYELAGKKYDELDAEVQEIINNADILVYSCPIDDVSKQEVKEIFRRLNNGKQLTNGQKNSVYIDDDLGKRIFDILENTTECIVPEETKKVKRGRPKAGTEGKEEAERSYIIVSGDVNFWGEVAVVGKGTIKNGEDKTLVLQCAMLISNYNGMDFDFQDISIKTYLQENMVDEDADYNEESERIIAEREEVYNKIKDAINSLAKGIIERRGFRKRGSGIAPEKTFKKVNIAPVVYGMSLAKECGNEEIYLDRLIKFFDAYGEEGKLEEYKRSTSGGTANKEKVQYRANYFKEMAYREATEEEKAELEKHKNERLSLLAMAYKQAEEAEQAATEEEEKLEEKKETEEKEAVKAEVTEESKPKKKTNPKSRKRKKVEKKGEVKVAETEGEVKAEEQDQTVEQVGEVQDQGQESTENQSVEDGQTEVAEQAEGQGAETQTEVENPELSETESWN